MASSHSIPEPAAYDVANFIAKMLQLDFPIQKRGVCVGLTMMWIHAVLGKQAKEFDDLIQLICTTRGPLLKKRIQAAEIKAAGLELLSDQEKSYLAILTLFRGITAYQIKQAQIEEVSRQVAGNEIIEKPGLVQTGLAPKMYSLAELTHYFESLALLAQQDLSPSTTEEKKLNEFVMRLNDYDHTIAIHFDSKNQQWLVCEPELVKIQVVPLDQIAQKVFHYFIEDNFLAFKPILFTTGDAPLPAATLRLFEEKHTITAEMGQRINADGKTLAIIAARAGDMALAATLANIREEKMGNTPLHQVVLLKAQEDKRDTSHKNSHLREAVGDIHSLLACGADFRIPNKANKTALTLMIESHQWEMIIAVMLKIKTLKEFHPEDVALLSANRQQLEKTFSATTPKQISKIGITAIAREENALGQFFKAKPHGFEHFHAKRYADKKVTFHFFTLIKQHLPSELVSSANKAKKNMLRK